jgi:hypothetical protein
MTQAEASQQAGRASRQPTSQDSPRLAVREASGRFGAVTPSDMFAVGQGDVAVAAFWDPVAVVTSTSQDGWRLPRISPDEFRMRRAAVAIEAGDRGLSALVLFSRGGTTVDFYGDVMYLADFHSAFAVVPDAAVWAARGHAALVVAVDGPSVLITDYFDDHQGQVQVDDVRVSLRVPAALGEVLRELELDGRPLGLVGGETMTVRWFAQVQQSAGRALQVTPADDILERQRLVKSEAELAFMRRAAEVGVGWMTTSMGAVAEGRTEAEVVGEGLRYLAAHGGTHADVAIASGLDRLPGTTSAAPEFRIGSMSGPCSEATSSTSISGVRLRTTSPTLGAQRLSAARHQAGNASSSRRQSRPSSTSSRQSAPGSRSPRCMSAARRG